MSEETKAAHISGRYLLVSVCLTAGLTFLLSLPIGLSIEKSKGATELDKISQQHSEELDLLNKKYTDLSKSYGESLTQLNELDSQYTELLKQYNNVLSENTRLTKLLENMGEATIPDKPDGISQHTSKFLSNLTPVSGTMA